MKVLVVGLGNIARRHIQNLKTVDPDIQIAVWRQRIGSDNLHDLSLQVDRFIYSMEDVLAWGADAAVVANPASMHLETGRLLAEQGVHLLMEKPVSNSLDGVDSLIDLCRHRGVVFMVGYNLRFYPPLRMMRDAILDGQVGRAISVRAEVGQYLPDWRSNRDYRQSVSARSDLGGGVVLELSHELDYVRWLMGEVKSVTAQLYRLSDLEVDVEDTAEILLTFSSGAIGNVHLDMVQRAPVRTCRIIGTEGTLAWDMMSNRVSLFRAPGSVWSDIHPAAAMDRNDMYFDEVRHFVNCIAGNAEPVVDGDEARRVLEIAVAVKRSSRERRMIEL